MIKVGSFHQIMSCPWHIFASEGINYGWGINCILYKSYIIDSSSHYFEKGDEGHTVDERQRMQSNADAYGSRINIYSTVTYLSYLFFINSMQEAKQE